jgi:lysyl-tRNA synthetase class 2
MSPTWWHPESLARRRPNLLARARIMAAMRQWFAAEDFVEVETPALQVSPGLEPHLMAFSTEILGPDGARRALHLHTSPEFAMKKLLAAGEPRICQFARVFRNGERSATHHPEFTMLDWYRAGADVDALIDDCAGLLRAAVAAAGIDGRLRRGPVACDPALPVERLPVPEAFARLGIDLLATAPDPLAPDAAALARAAEGIGIRTAPGDRWDDIFFRIFLERIEPTLGSPAPTAVTHWPIAMAALARPDPADPRVARRFELYVAGVELANAFGELTDPTEQRRRFEADRATAEALYGRAYPIDEDFMAALDQGLPESAGIALGIDRLVMLATGATTIDDVLWAPVAAPEAPA